VFTWTGFWSLNPEYLREEPFDLTNVFFCTTFTVLALIGLGKALRRSRSAVMPYALVLLAFPIPYYLTHSDISYRQPLNPEIVILASVAAVSRRKSALILEADPACIGSGASAQGSAKLLETID
jgi:hypothetical protein